LNASTKNGSVKSPRHHERSTSYFDGWVETVRRSTAAAAVKAMGTNVESNMEPVVVIKDNDGDDDETEKEQDVSQADLVTPTPSVPSSPLPGRYNSFPPLRPQFGLLSPSTTTSRLSAPSSLSSHTDLSGLLSPLGDSTASTPSVTEASSPSRSSQSPSSPPHSLPLSPSADLNVSALLGLENMDRTTKRMGLDDKGYNVFVNRYCFYTGGDGPGVVATVSDAMPESAHGDPRRIHSESEVDNYFAAHHHHQHHSANFGGFGFGYNSPPSVGSAPWSPGSVTSGHATPTGRSGARDD